MGKQLIVKRYSAKYESKYPDCGLDEMKSLAGSLFHQDDIMSVTIVEQTGSVLFYMNKARPREVWILPESE